MNSEAERLAEKGYAHFKIGRFPEAKACFEQALQLAPTDADMRRVYAHILFTLKRSDEAAIEMEKAVEYAAGGPNEAQVHSDAAALFLELGQIDRARSIIEAAECRGLRHRNFGEMKQEIKQHLSKSDKGIRSDSPYDRLR